MKAPHIKDSYIVKFFAHVFHVFYSLLPFCLLGRIFTSYSAADNALRNSAVGRACNRTDKGGKRRHSFRRNIALAMSKSRIINAAGGFWRLLCQCSLRTFGVLLATTGVYCSMLYWLFTVIWKSTVVSSLDLYWGIGFLVLGVLLMFSDLSLGYALTKSFFFGKFVVSALGVSDGGIRTVERVGRRGYVVAVPLGMALGALGALTSLAYLVAGFALLLLAMMVLSIPEAGVVVLIFATPFIGLLPGSHFWLVLWILLVFAAYVGKLLRGNRAFHMELQDVPVLLIAVLFVLSGFSFAGNSAFSGALLSALMVAAYFLVVNLIATPRWMNRCRVALILSAALSSALGIVQFIVAAVTSAGDLQLVLLGGAVRAGFYDRISFVYFLIVAFPFTLMAFMAEKNSYRLLTGLALVTILAAVVITFVPAAVLAVLVMLVVFALLYFRHSLPFVLLGGLLVSFLGSFVPRSARSQLFRLLRVDVVSGGAYRASLDGLTTRVFFSGGEGVFQRSTGFMRFLVGLGYGGAERFCAYYTSVPAEAVAVSVNFWTYRLLEGGVFGVLLPAALFFLLCQNCFSLMRRDAGESVRYFTLTGIILAAGTLLFGFWCYTWYDPAALLLFFAACAMIAADARSTRQSTVILSKDYETEKGKSAEIEYYGTGR